MMSQRLTMDILHCRFLFLLDRWRSCGYRADRNTRLGLHALEDGSDVVGAEQPFGQRDDASANTLAEIIPKVHLNVDLEGRLALGSERREIP